MIVGRSSLVRQYVSRPGPHGFILSFREDKKLKRAVFASFDVSFPEATATFGFGINTRGQIIGIYNDSTGEHGFAATLSEHEDHSPRVHHPESTLPRRDQSAW